MMLPNHLILCHPLFLLPFLASGSFLMSWLFASGGQIIGASASAIVYAQKESESKVAQSCPTLCDPHGL